MKVPRQIEDCSLHLTKVCHRYSVSESNTKMTMISSAFLLSSSWRCLITYYLWLNNFRVEDVFQCVKYSEVIGSVKPIMAFSKLNVLSLVVAANNLACKGLDHLEEKIPALQYPPEKARKLFSESIEKACYTAWLLPSKPVFFLCFTQLASGIVDAVTSTVQTAKEGIASPIAGTSDRVLSMASSWLQLTRSAFSDGFSYVLSSKPVHLAGEGADTALTLAESLVNYVLPGSSEENGILHKRNVFFFLLCWVSSDKNMEWEYDS